MKKTKLQAATKVADLIDADALTRYADDVADRAASYLAEDVRRSAKRSMKSGIVKRGVPKSEWTKLGKTSKPGESPRYHRSKGLRERIERAKLNARTHVVGPAKTLWGDGTPKTLEKGGRGKVSATVYSERYKKRAADGAKKPRKKDAKGRNISRPCERHGTVRGARPEAARVYYVGLTKIDRYRYFYSREEWESARTSPSFLRWANGAKRVETIYPTVAPRPYMAPALSRETTPEKSERRLKNAAKNAARVAVASTLNH